MPEFLVLALLAGLGVSVVTGPLGAFVVWRRMAYFGDTLAHGALLGVALSMWFAIDPTLAVALVCIALALLLTALQKQRLLSTDTTLGILAHSALALGLVAITLIPGARADMEGLLFGDILAVTPTEVITIWLTACVVAALLWKLWRPLLAITVHLDLAQVEGVAVSRVTLALKLMLALVVAVAIKVVGVLLITALLIIPAAAARSMARNPESMVVMASAIGAGAVTAGLAAAWFWNMPAGPAIVLSATLIFVLSLLPSSARQQS